MALFSDGPAPSIEDLANEDSGILDVSRDCSINLSTKMLLAHNDLSIELQAWLDKPKPAADMVWGSWPTLAQIVVTPQLKRWETFHSLVLVYRDAYFSQLVDRYQSKWQEYLKLARDARDQFVASGLPLAFDPVSQAFPPLLASVAGPQQGGTFYASVTWVNAAGQEGAPSFSSSLTVADGSLMSVAADRPAKNVVAYNVYAGRRLDSLCLQNDVPLPLTASFTYVPGFMTGSRKAGDGQCPDVVRPMRRTWMRG